jgi:hypothetical protein
VVDSVIKRYDSDKIKQLVFNIRVVLVRHKIKKA